MEKSQSFNSEFCSVSYIEKENAVLLSWKKFCSLEDYRKPALFALELLKSHPKANFIVDARNGFEDEKEDAEWAFSKLLPEMAKTGCRIIVFIMNKSNDIEEEMNMWETEFGKYFGVCKVSSFEEAIEAMNSEIHLHVSYSVKPGKRDEFVKAVKEAGIINASRAEPGNLFYKYYYPEEDKDTVFLLECWTNEEAFKNHGLTGHYQKLGEFKKEFVESVEIKKFVISDTL